MASVRTYITETEFARIENPQSSTTYIVLDDNDPTLVKKVVFKTNNINKEGELYIVQDEFPTPSGTVEITANGDNIDVKQYATANVNVPNPSTGTLNITANDDYDVTDYAGVSVNVPNPSTGTLNITANDDYDVTDYAGVSVNVPNPSTGTLNITANDDYDVTDYAGVSVNVPNPSTGTLVITSNDTFDVTDYASAQVNVQAPIKTCSFKFNSDGQFQFIKNGYGSYYLKVNDGEWTEYTTSQTVSVVDGDVIELKSDVKQYLATGVFTFNDNPNSTTAVSWELEGDLLGALYGDMFPIRGCYEMFKNCTGLTKVPSDMFTNCEYASDRGCQGMFYGCTSLTTAPALPATILSNYCYYQMFYKCTSLTTALALPATTLAENCYAQMFRGCTSLTTALALPATTLAKSCYHGMFWECTSLTTAPELPTTTLAPNCYQYMFKDCTSLTTAPELPATTLAAYCYSNMFQDCTSLNYVKCLATSGINNNNLSEWLYRVAATGTFVKDANTTWSTGTSGIPSGWTVVNA